MKSKAKGRTFNLTVCIVKSNTQKGKGGILANTYVSAVRTIFLEVVSITLLVEVTDNAELGGVAEVVSSNPTVGHKIFFSIYRHS